ncbi:hypothetical protein VTN77DRAFT_6499 [Rasamsonia byssochlamydoides]|uniref:uncharacterized protein n=1 Tax=Rasamsonia byssochlamydoides TaxID=89139 RepID=UPI003742084E
MSFCRHAYRHALRQQPTAALLDHVWISEEHLASAFRRFVNCQRRHESRVPGPLEARKRLAKRKNTALAGVGASGPPAADVGGLFGMNGSGHMQRKDNDSPWTRSWPEPLEVFSYPIPPPEPGEGYTSVDGIPFDSGIPFESAIPFDSGPDDPGDADEISRDEVLEKLLENCWTVQDIRKVIDQLPIDLQREPAYSLMVFSNLLSKSIHCPDRVFDEALLFLDDPALNPPGAGNYLTLVEHLVGYEATTVQRHKLLGAVERAIELGLIPGTEIGLIIRTLPNIKLGGTTLKQQENLGELARHHRRIWEALRGCSVLRLKDLDEGVLDRWLEQLVDAATPNEELLLLAKDIVLAGQGSSSTVCRWIPTLIRQCLSLSADPMVDESYFAYQTNIVNYVSDLLSPLDADLALGYIIQVSEALAFSQTSDGHRHAALKIWRDCLLDIPNVASLASSRVWMDVGPFDSPKFSTHHRVILRLWVLSSLSKSVHRDLIIWQPQPKATDPVVSALLRQFDLLTSDRNDADFFFNLVVALQELNLPYNHVLLMVFSVLATKYTNNRFARRVIEKLECSQMTMEDVVAHTFCFNATKSIFYPTFERMIRRIDVTSSEFLRDSIRLAESGRQGAFEFQRLLSRHTPLKIALAKSWSWQVRYHADIRRSQTSDEPESERAESSSSEYPDPEACLEMIHVLALSFAGSDKLSEKLSFYLVHWLYKYLRRHNAPIKPALVRALYHSGVVRFRRAGRRVPVPQYQFIMDLVREVEGGHVVRALDSGHHYVAANWLQMPERYLRDDEPFASHWSD